METITGADVFVTPMCAPARVCSATLKTRVSVGAAPSSTVPSAVATSRRATACSGDCAFCTTTRSMLPTALAAAPRDEPESTDERNAVLAEADGSESADSGMGALPDAKQGRKALRKVASSAGPDELVGRRHAVRLRPWPQKLALALENARVEKSNVAAEAFARLAPERTDTGSKLGAALRKTAAAIALTARSEDDTSVDTEPFESTVTKLGDDIAPLTAPSSAVAVSGSNGVAEKETLPLTPAGGRSAAPERTLMGRLSRATAETASSALPAAWLSRSDGCWVSCTRPLVSS